MSYSRSLDEIPTVELLHELEERTNDRLLKRCDYCQRKPSSSPCKFPERHNPKDAKPTHVKTLLEGGMTQHVFVFFVKEES